VRVSFDAQRKARQVCPRRQPGLHVDDNALGPQVQPEGLLVLERPKAIVCSVPNKLAPTTTRVQGLVARVQVPCL
jgi:hypothetical protein